MAWFIFYESGFLRRPGFLSAPAARLLPICVREVWAGGCGWGWAGFGGVLWHTGGLGARKAKVYRKASLSFSTTGAFCAAASHSLSPPNSGAFVYET